jgi:hypothetical protein
MAIVIPGADQASIDQEILTGRHGWGLFPDITATPYPKRRLKLSFPWCQGYDEKQEK